MKVHKCGVVVKACPNSAITPAFVHIPLSYFAKLCYNNNLYEFNSISRHVHPPVCSTKIWKERFRHVDFQRFRCRAGDTHEGKQRDQL